ncbi:hypothetical protein [Streptomyces sp. SID161]|uniref:hypothetical protein n=1 Tax=Streptomyces sp. SID161 TaxID=2690251 RepID=UPI00136EC05C|nr:hypothetical protein [Streptomyces sp. SID161]MYW46356.1 hypothetical protein [Streptomyces sp. SID161]
MPVAPQLVTTIYDSITDFQQAAQLSSLHHHQMRLYLAEHLADTLLAAAAPAGPAPATDRGTLRDRIALAIEDAPFRVDGTRRAWQLADAVLAVLPAPDQQTAEIRAAIFSDLIAKAQEWDGHITVQELRRRAGEAQQDEAAPRPAACRCHSREGLTPQQHENDCPLAQPAREARQDPAQDGRAAALRMAANYVRSISDDRRWGRASISTALCSVSDQLARWADEAQPAAVARSGQPETDESEELVHVGWWCWRGDNHGHLATMACRSDNVPIHVPAEWADEMRAALQRIEDGDEPETD